MRSLINTSLFFVFLSIFFAHQASASSELQMANSELCICQSTYSCEDPTIRTLYFKGGSGLGLGYRTHNTLGYDISAGYTEWGIANWLSINGSFLYYPSQRLYVGVGAGIVFETTRLIVPGPSTDHHGPATYPTLDCLLGYEFYQGEKCSWFIQLEIAKPLIKRAMGDCLPALYMGIGF